MANISEFTIKFGFLLKNIISKIDVYHKNHYFNRGYGCTVNLKKDQEIYNYFNEAQQDGETNEWNKDFDLSKKKPNPKVAKPKAEETVKQKIVRQEMKKNAILSEKQKVYDRELSDAILAEVTDQDRENALFKDDLLRTRDKTATEIKVHKGSLTDLKLKERLSKIYKKNGVLEISMIAEKPMVAKTIAETL